MTLTGKFEFVYGYASKHEGKWFIWECSLNSDNPPCCNLAHLFLGTQAENMSDMARKGRQYSKLTADQVVEIRRGLSSGKSRAELSSTYGVDVTTIGLIARGEWWRHTW